MQERAHAGFPPEAQVGGGAVIANLLLLLADSVAGLGILGAFVWLDTRQQSRRGLVQRAADAAERAREDAVLDAHFATLPDFVTAQYAHREAS